MVRNLNSNRLTRSKQLNKFTCNPVTQDNQNFQLLDCDTILKFQKQFNFLHLGLVQVGVKPMTRLHLNKFVICTLRDMRHHDSDDSLLGVIKSSLAHGPIYFEYFPNFEVSLVDPTILKTLTLDIQPIH